MKQAVVLLNMGGPSNTDEVRVFLKNMFADPNILTVKSSLLRWFIGTMIVLTRTKKAKGHYEEIGGRSPLLGLTEKLAAKLSSLRDQNVYIVMRYVPPFASEVIKQMMDDGVEEIVLFPMYPQYSTTTTKSSLEDFHATAIKMGFHPKVHTVENFYKNREINTLIVEKIIETLGGEEAGEYDIVFSAHSLPQNIIDAGDEYERQVEEHTEILQNMLYMQGANFRKAHLAYQSKLGPVKWLGPSLEEMLHKISQTNKKVVIYPISFTVDNVETVYELGIEYEEVAKKFGFEAYKVVSCPNDDEDFARALSEIIDEKMES